MNETIMLGSELKKQFPIFQNNIRLNKQPPQSLVYLDSAVTTHKPRIVIDAMKHFLEHDYGSIHRGAYQLSIASSEMYENTRQKVAQFIGKNVKANQIIFTKGTTESLNILANGFKSSLLTENDRIVVPLSEHHANFVPWQQTALYKNCEIGYIPLHEKKEKGLSLNLSEAQKLITSKTKIVTLASMGNVLGQINPIAEITAMAKKVGAYVFLDCAQSASCIEDDYFALGVDAIAFGGHKMYGPTGIGVLALSEELMDKLPPLLYGGGMISAVGLEESTWTTGPAKFEAGTPPIAEVYGLGVAIDWILNIGRNKIHTHSSNLASKFIERLEKLPDIEIFAPKTGHESIVAFRHNKIHAHDLVTILDTFHVNMRAGHHCAWPLIKYLGVDALVRCSFGAYSDENDIERAIEAIQSCSKYL